MSVRHSYREKHFCSPLQTCHFLVTTMGWISIIVISAGGVWHQSTNRENFKLMNQMFREHAEESVWEYQSNACASFADLLLQYYHGQHN